MKIMKLHFSLLSVAVAVLFSNKSFAATCEEIYDAAVAVCGSSRDLCKSIYPVDVPVPFNPNDDRFFQCEDEDGNLITPGRSKRELCEWSYKNCERDAAIKKEKCIKARGNPVQPAPTPAPKNGRPPLSDEAFVLNLLLAQEIGQVNVELSDDSLWSGLQQQTSVHDCVVNYHADLANCMTTHTNCISGCSSRNPTDPMEGPCKNETLADCVLNCSRMMWSCRDGAEKVYDRCKKQATTTPRPTPTR